MSTHLAVFIPTTVWKPIRKREINHSEWWLRMLSFGGRRIV